MRSNLAASDHVIVRDYLLYARLNSARLTGQMVFLVKGMCPLNQEGQCRVVNSGAGKQKYDGEKADMQAHLGRWSINRF